MLHQLAHKYSLFIIKNKYIKLAIALNHLLFKPKTYYKLYTLSALTFAFLKIKAGSRCSLFSGTTNLKRTACSPRAAWGADFVLNYLKEINNASCPWRAAAAEEGGFPQHPELSKKSSTSSIPSNKGKVGGENLSSSGSWEEAPGNDFLGVKLNRITCCSSFSQKPRVTRGHVASPGARHLGFTGAPPPPSPCKPVFLWP